MGDELRHLNTACGCVLPEDNPCEDHNTCGCFGGNWIWIILFFIFFCCCGKNGSNGICGITSCNIDCSDLLIIILIILFLNCFCGDGEGGLFGGIFG